MNSINRTKQLRHLISAQIVGIIAVLLPLASLAGPAETELAGLWEARQILGPAVSGPMVIRKVGDRLVAEIGGHRIAVDVDNDAVSFALSNGAHFSGVTQAGGDIHGHWLQSRSRLDGNVFATPVKLRARADGWYGEITPQPDTATFYLLLQENGDELTAEMINPDRNLGVFSQLTRLVRDGDDFTLMGSFRGRGPEREMFHGTWFPDEQVLAMRYRGRGGAYDFYRADAETSSGFLARTSPTDLMLSPPPMLDDGWETASPADVGIDIAFIENMIKTRIMKSPASSNDLSVHALLIARSGKLVVEEYFHGYHRDLPHDSRSGSKSVTSILAAALMHSGGSLEWDTPIYSLFGLEQLLREQPERGKITFRNLINMNTGLDCDDRNPDSAAFEDNLWDHADELDFYEHTLNVDVVHAPEEVAAYCSASANLAGGAIEAAAGESLLSLIDRLVAQPLDINRYSVPVPPDGHPFMGGGTRWLARDFLKFPQLLLDGGVWNGTRIISKDNASRLINPEVKLDGGRDYGYLWWTEDYPFRGRILRAHFMGGNGGQIAMLVPELDLSIVFNAGNYSSRVGFQVQEELIPEFILPAVMQ